MSHFLRYIESGSPYLPAGVTDSDFDGDDGDLEQYLCEECDEPHDENHPLYQLHQVYAYA